MLWWRICSGWNSEKIQKYVGKYNFINELSDDDYEYNMQTLNISNGTLQVKNNR